MIKHGSSNVVWGAALCWLATAAGCSWFGHQRHARGPLPPPAFPDPPRIETVIETVNRNADAVQRLQTDGASLSIEGVPASLQAQLALEKPRRFRLTARLSGFTGRELDMGSNDELFWLWIRRNPKPAVFFARHTQFATSPAAQFVAVDPVFLIDSLGLVRLDPDGQHQGPFPAGDGRLEVRSILPKPDGPWTRVMILDDRYGWILEQHLYNPAGRLVASVRADDFEYSESHQSSLPHSIRLQLGPGQPGQLALKLDVASYAINQLTGDAGQLWQMPHYDDAPPIDIASPQFQPNMLAPAPQIVPPPEHWQQAARPQRFGRFR